MIHALKIENDSLVIDVHQVLMYNELAPIYKRDTSKNKEFAFKEFKYIIFLSDNNGFCSKAGLSPKEAHAFAVKNAGLNYGYKPDKTVLDAIRFVKSSLNILPVEKLIDTTVVTLTLATDVIEGIRIAFQKFLSDEKATIEQTSQMYNNLKNLLKETKDIPDTIALMIKLREDYDKADKGVSIIRGGLEYKNSFDGDYDEEPTSANKVEHLD